MIEKKRIGKVIKNASDWTKKNHEIIDRIEEMQFGARIVIKIKNYMRANNLSQKQLADLLSVTPQYINKILHGDAADMKISTAIRYGKILGIELVTIPKENPTQSTSRVFLKASNDWESIANKFFYYNNQQILLQHSKRQDKYGKRPS